ncbi:hypothetical protein H6G17_31345 [Chroococcidiopsis sp. FACHB-1243]|uniref:hypothetical protein n=1 Tax=Chroococcidiopsis sp. [FACHB-1243] TaxID=2692781 RepID=UPI00177CB301|nr:hypothetical protein [Chroococcidiopsis sp. [FACHB-1243]]MBD2309905.1 hypothetical protein [Chroococcidiopsis sp. [FACHB-1243]]
MVIKLIVEHGYLSDALDSLTLDRAYQLIGDDPPSRIPFLVWLLENPDSLFALPRNIYLKEHGFIHLLLKRGFSSDDEAYVIGFTMGNDSKTKRWHLLIFQLFSIYFYPKKYKVSRENTKAFKQGFLMGKEFSTQNLNKIDFQSYLDRKLSEIRVSSDIITTS